MLIILAVPCPCGINCCVFPTSESYLPLVLVISLMLVKLIVVLPSLPTSVSLILIVPRPRNIPCSHQVDCGILPLGVRCVHCPRVVVAFRVKLNDVDCFVTIS